MKCSHVFSALVLASMCILPQTALLKAEAEDVSRVLQVTISDEIEPGIAAFLARALAKAEHENYDALLMRVNTPGGRLDAALYMKDQLLDARVPVIAFVDRQALSAGALIALAATEVYLARGGVMGAATPVMGGQGAEAPEKIVSATRQAFAGVAEARGRPAELAMAMVDGDIEVEGVIAKGKVLTVTAEEAVDLGLADGVVSGRDELIAKLGWEKAAIIELKPTFAELVARFFTSSVIVPLLLTLGTLGLIIEVKSPGFGVAGSIGLISLALFFWSQHIAGLAGYEGMILVAVGILLLAVEAFILPGFGVAGLAGIGAILGGIYLTILGDPSFATYEQYIATAWVLVAALFMVVMSTLFLARILPSSGRMGGLVLSKAAAANQMITTQRENPVTVGDKGVALSDLRPAGIARFGDQRLDVVTQGEYLNKACPIEVVSVFGNRIVVTKHDLDGDASS